VLCGVLQFWFELGGAFWARAIPDKPMMAMLANKIFCTNTPPLLICALDLSHRGASESNKDVAQD
jgi:hypothetical protein